MAEHNESNISKALDAALSSGESKQKAGSNICTLPDGRKLGYHITGDLNGYPMFFFHGCPSSRLEANDWHEFALPRKVCIIGVDRPGMGDSTYASKYSILDWPADILALASHLQIKQFKVFGASGGGPFALACAKDIPSDVLEGTGVIAGMAPPEAGYEGAALERKLAYYFNTYVPPSVLHFIIYHSLVKHVNNKEKFTDYMTRGVINRMPPEDAKWFDEAKYPGNRDALIETEREGFKNGGWGYIVDAKNLIGKWPFKVEDVKAKVTVWNGTDDINTPVQMARWMAERLENGRLIEYKGLTHFGIVFEKSGEILDEMLAM